MTVSYTDVDRLIFERWEEVMGLREAFDDVQGRIEETFKEVGSRLEKWASSAGYTLETAPRNPCYSAWKPTWENRKKYPTIWLEIGDFAPRGYRKNDSEHPYLWVITQQLETLKMREEDRVAFARELKQALGERAGQWENDETSDADEPLGRFLTNISDRDRVAMIADPDKLFAFVKSGLTELFTISDAIDQTLTRLRP